MPRILVADDNSNIQKMVALALKGEGIEVVAVGNGDAAVRKMPEQPLDLILADIFMPVRNGYEVCEFVKLDPRYMHIPVVLLVGAFDPLDEREAQRVHADGVLKKPFVPPDPLINMVKALLAKSASERLVAVAVPVAAASAAAEAKHAPAPAPAVEAAVDEYIDLPTEESAAPASRVEIEEYEKPVAFSPSFETPTAEMDEVEPMVTASRDPSLGEPAFWRRPSKAEDLNVVIEEVTEDHGWGNRKNGKVQQRDEVNPLPAIEPVGVEALVEDAGAEFPKEEYSGPAVEVAGETAYDVASAHADLDAPLVEGFVDKLVDMGVTEGIAGDDEPFAVQDAMAGMIAFPSPPASSEPASTDSFDAEESAVLWPPEAPPAIIEFPATGSGKAAPEAHDVLDVPEASVAEEVEVIEATSGLPPAFQAMLASTIVTANSSDATAEPETASADSITIPEANFASDLEADLEEPASVLPPAFQAVLASAIEAAKLSVSTAELEPASAESATPTQAESTSDFEPAPAVAQPSQTPSETLEPASPEMVDAVVARIIARIHPEIMEAVTRELRPVVEALVRRETDKR